MTHATFNAGLVKQAASKALEERQRLPNQDEKIGRLGELADIATDLIAQQGPTATIGLDLEDHKLLHGRFPPQSPAVGQATKAADAYVAKAIAKLNELLARLTAKK